MLRLTERLGPIAGLMLAVLAAGVALSAWAGEHALQRARRARSRGDLRGAVESYRAALELGGGVEPAVELARLTFILHDLEAANSHVQTAMALSPAASYPHVLAGAIEMRRPGPWDLRREERVLEAVRTAVRLAPSQAALRREGGALLLGLARRDGGASEPGRAAAVLVEARAHYEKALQLEPAAARATLASAAAAGADEGFLRDLASLTGAASRRRPAEAGGTLRAR